MELTITDNKAVLSLPENHRPFIQAKIGKPCIKDISDLDLATGIQKLLTRSFAEMGHTSAAEGSAMTFLRTTLLTDLRKPKYKALTFEEVCLFVGNGIRGDYGSFKNQLNTINIQNLIFWINQGMASEAITNAMKEFNRKLEESELKTTEKPLQIKQAQSKEGIIKAFEEYKKSGLLPFRPCAYYDLLVEFKQMKSLFPDVQTFKKIQSEVKKEFERNWTVSKKTAEQRGESNTAEALMDRLMNLESDPHSDVINEIKTRGLKLYFDTLIREGKEIGV